jgi:hypothetical protein
MKHAKLLLVGALLVLAMVGGRARANIAFEYYEVQRPEIAEAPVGAFLNELSKLGYVANPRDVIDRLGSQAALPAIANPKLTAQKLLASLTKAHTLWTKAPDFAKLAPVLAEAVTTALANPALVVTDPSIRDALQNALLDLALVYGKLKNDARFSASAEQLEKSSDDMMAEWIRTFRNKVIPQSLGPEAAKMYIRVGKARNKLGRGVLSVSVDDANVLLYVNEAIQSRLQPIPDLVPGPYRVLLMGPNDDARLFLVEVLPNQTTRLDVQWAVSSNLSAESSSVAFVFASSTHPEASTLACRLARATGNSSGGVVLTGMTTIGQTWALRASLYDARTCQLVRGGHVAFYAAANAKGGRALARFIARRARDPDVIVGADVDPAKFQTPDSEGEGTPKLLPAAPTAAATSTPRNWWAWGATAGSAAAFAIGGYGLYRHYGRCGQPGPAGCRYYYADSDLAGYGGISAGVALGALATYLFLRDDAPGSRASTITIAPLRAGAFVGLAGRL